MENNIDPFHNPVGYQNKVLDMMKNYEDLIGDLYAVYAEKEIGPVDFWKKIEEEERLHAYWVRTLANSLGDGKIFFNEKRFSLAALEQVTGDIEEKIKQAKDSDLSLLNALAVSYDVETGMIERKFFEIFESDSAEIKETFSMLEDATVKHRAAVKELLDEERRNKPSSKVGLWQKTKSLFQ